MAKLPILSSKDVIRVLNYLSFEPAPKRGKGSHSAFIKKTGERTYLVIVPDRGEIPKGTLLSIIEQMGLTKIEFIKILRKLQLLALHAPPLTFYGQNRASISPGDRISTKSTTQTTQTRKLTFEDVINVTNAPNETAAGLLVFRNPKSQPAPVCGRQAKSAIPTDVRNQTDQIDQTDVR